MYAYSDNTGIYDAPPSVTDWTFPAENATIFGVTLSCTCKSLGFILLVVFRSYHSAPHGSIAILVMGGATF